MSDRLPLKQAQRSDKICPKHSTQLLKCPAKNCTGCWYLNICKDNAFCSECGYDIIRAKEHRERAKGIVKTEVARARLEIDKQKSKGKSDRSQDALDRAEKNLSFWLKDAAEEWVHKRLVESEAKTPSVGDTEEPQDEPGKEYDPVVTENSDGSQVPF